MLHQIPLSLCFLIPLVLGSPVDPRHTYAPQTERQSDEYPLPVGLSCFEGNEDRGTVRCETTQASPFTEDVVRLAGILKSWGTYSLVNANTFMGSSGCKTVARATNPYTGKVDICGVSPGYNKVMKWESWCVGDEVERIIRECSTVVAKGQDGQDERPRAGGYVRFSEWGGAPGNVEVSS